MIVNLTMLLEVKRKHIKKGVNCIHYDDIDGQQSLDGLSITVNVPIDKPKPVKTEEVEHLSCYPKYIDKKFKSKLNDKLEKEYKRFLYEQYFKNQK